MSDPLNCGGGGIKLDLFRTPSQAHVGDTVTYSVFVSNPVTNSNCDIADVAASSITPGDVLHQLPVPDFLPVGRVSGPFNVTYTILSEDVLGDTVKATAHASGTISDGLCNNTTTASSQVCVFVARPRIQVTKRADTERSKAGDVVNYTIEITNIGNITLNRRSVTDTLLRDITTEFAASLRPGQSSSATIPYTVPLVEPGLLTNTVTATYTDVIADDHSTVSASAEATVDIFRPSVRVEKSGPAFSKAGDTIHYNFTITNTSSLNSPPLLPDSITDDLLELNGKVPPACQSLNSGESCSFSADYPVTDETPSPLTNTVTVHYHPEGFRNDISDAASHTVTILHPDFDVTKTCSKPGVPGGEATFNVTVTNTGDVALDFTTSETSTPFTLEPFGGTITFPVSVAVPPASQGNCPREVSNTIRVTASLERFGLTNLITKEASGTCRVVTLGLTPGFWRSKNGQTMITAKGLLPTAIGSGSRTISVTTLSQSNQILSNDLCDRISCTNLSDALNPNTLEILAAHTLALDYNIRGVTCYGGQTIGGLGCTSLLPTALPPEVPALNASSTVEEVFTVANLLIGGSVSDGFTTQDAAGQMNALLGCLNRERV